MNKDDLTALTEAPANELLEGALTGISSDDRNVRVLAVRMLQKAADAAELSSDQYERAVAGLRAGLDDPKRRVREVALKSSSPFLGHPDIVERIREMVEDGNEKRRIRTDAIRALSSASALGQAGAEAIAQILEIPGLRRVALLWLAQMPVTEQVKGLLEEFVEHGTREEAIMATRALCGYRIVNLGAIDASERRAFAQSADLAFGRAWYWIKRD